MKLTNDVGGKKVSLLVAQYDFDSDMLFTDKNFESDGLVYVGGGKSAKMAAKEGFGGCIAWVYLNSRQLDLYNPNQAPLEGLQQCRNR